MKSTFKSFSIILLCFSLVTGQADFLSDFIADTLFIHLSADSMLSATDTALQIVDNRNLPDNILGIQQIKKWKYIPVDQYIAINKPLTDVLQRYMMRDSISFDGTFVIDNLTYWKDNSPAFAKGRMLNGYTKLVDNEGGTLCDWLWEFRLKQKRKQSDTEIVATLTEEWISAQSSVLQEKEYYSEIYPYSYRRQLISWFDIIVLGDGYIINGHLTLDFPGDRMKRYVRGSPGMYYRRSSLHESIAIGGLDQQWYYRLNDKFISRLNTTFRFGFNSFNSKKLSHVDIWNIVMINIGLTAAVEYRPLYHKWLFFGAGLYQSINILPEIIKRYEPGILFTIGIILP